MTGAERPTIHEALLVTDATQIYLTEIGTLVQRDEVWRLTYAECGHIQDVPRYGLDPDQAVDAVRRDYRHCMVCAQSQSRRVRVRSRQSSHS